MLIFTIQLHTFCFNSPEQFIFEEQVNALNAALGSYPENPEPLKSILHTMTPRDLQDIVYCRDRFNETPYELVQKLFPAVDDVVGWLGQFIKRSSRKVNEYEDCMMQ